MVMRIFVNETGSANALVQKLSALVGADRVAHWGEQNEVDVRIEGDAEHAILRVLDAVDGWLDQSVGRSSQMRLGQHSYTMAR